MRKISLATATLLAIGLVASTAFARTECNDTVRVCFDVPDGWVTTSQGETIVIRPPDGGMALEVRGVTDIAQIDRSRRSFEAELTGRFQDLRYRGEARPVQQNGLMGMLRGGQGTFDGGQPMEFFMVALGHAGGGVVALGVVTRRNYERNGPIMRRILDSFRPMS